MATETFPVAELHLVIDVTNDGAEHFRVAFRAPAGPPRTALSIDALDEAAARAARAAKREWRERGEGETY